MGLGLGYVGHHVKTLQAPVGHAILGMASVSIYRRPEGTFGLFASKPVRMSPVPTNGVTQGPGAGARLSNLPGAPPEQNCHPTSGVWGLPAALRSGKVDARSQPSRPRASTLPLRGAASNPQTPGLGWQFCSGGVPRSLDHPTPAPGAVGHSVCGEILTGLEANKPKWPSGRL